MMAQAMVTGRMVDEKKRRANLILEREGLNASQAINLMYDRIIEDGNAEFLVPGEREVDLDAWKRAAEFVDSLSEKRVSRFDDMTKAQIRMDRLAKRGLTVGC